MHRNHMKVGIVTALGFLLGTGGLAAAKDADDKDAQKDRIEERARNEKDRIDERAKMEKDRVDERARREKADLDLQGSEGRAKIGEVREVRDETNLGEEVSDAWITTKVKAEFLGEKKLKGSDISVDTEDRGVVILSGYVPHNTARARAVQIVRTVKGVRQVRDKLKTGKKSQARALE